MTAPRSRAQWRSLDALAETPSFRAFLEREFPAVTDLSTGPERRSFLKLMAASFAMAGLSGCDAPPDGRDQEVPYVRAPERMEPSTSLHYATTALLDGFANGVLVTTRNGRPLKIEGNPEHPWSRGGTDALGQASVLGLYDPNRSQSVRHLGRASSWQAFRGATTGPFATMRENGGNGMRLLTGPITSPSLLNRVHAMQAAYPGMHWHSYAPVDRAALYDGTRRTFGAPLETRWRFDQARVIVALDGDFLDAGPQQVGTSRDWIAGRRAFAASGALPALHVAGPIPNLTLAKADHPLPAAQADIAALAHRLLSDLAGPGAPSPAEAGASPLETWRARAAAALHGARGASLVIAGSTQPPEVQEMVHRLNAALGNQDRTVFYTQPVLAAADDLASLVAASHDGQVQTLVVLGANPAYDAPGELGFSKALGRIPLKIHAGLYADETALRSDWHIPMQHPLEAWGDARSLDGTVSLIQPTVAALYDGRSPAEILALLTDGQEQAGRDMLRAYWQGTQTEDDFTPRWEAMLEAGFVPDSAFHPVPVQLTPAPPDASPAGPAGLEIVFRPDGTVWDGSVADNAWLQELPKPLTKLVWENAITVGPALAAREKLAQGDIVVLAADGRQIEGPVWILPGQADGMVGVSLGYGREVADNLSYGLGYNAYPLRAAGDPWRLPNATLRKAGRSQNFVTTQDHSTMEGHAFVRVQHEGTAPAGDNDAFTQPTLYPAQEADGRAWGMVIDLDACIGCNSCVTACQSENNIAVVGREQVAMGREMHWLRVDRYYEGPVEAPRTRFQPIPCMHCEQAPCEVGCPVEATLHDHEGLNLMVYNRCVGTRACSGYCPYKVRHFNYLDYSAGAAPSAALQRNPGVTVRARGVMEKCTYCVQRIAEARIASDKSSQPIADGVVQTACQGACPTQAITFGDLNDAGSAVAAARKSPRNYALLGELNARPRTTYLAALAPRTTEG